MLSELALVLSELASVLSELMALVLSELALVLSKLQGLSPKCIIYLHSLQWSLSQLNTRGQTLKGQRLCNDQLEKHPQFARND